MIRSTSACMAIRARRGLYGSPETEKIGSFCDSTSELKTSIIGMLVRIMFFGMIRFAGLTDGVPVSMRFSSRRGPLSRGSPLPSKMRPSRLSEKEICMGCPMKTTSSPVDMPRPPVNTCNETWSPLKRMTSARDSPWRAFTNPRCPYRTSFAVTVMTLPSMESILL